MTEFDPPEAGPRSSFILRAAGGTPVKQPTFSFPVTNQPSFLKLAAAGSIVQIEARHAASIALLTGDSATPNGAFDKPLSKKQVLAKAGPLIKA
jgi:hypothetical protein